MTTVFLSYGRGDDEPFVERLCQALKARGLDVWYDRVSMPSRRLTFHQEIRDAIAARERLVLVVGPHAVLSEYVRQEWQFALEADKVVTPILRVGDYPLVPDELKLLHCEDFRDDARFEFHLDKLARQLSEPPPPLGKLIAVPSLPPHYLARTDRLKALRDAVRADLDRPVVLTGETARVGMHGMGGIGKSVLAAALVRDRLVREAFPDGIVWVGLGSLPTITELQRRVHRDLGGDGAIATEHEGKTKLKELLDNKSVLLVLDDVWRRSDADAFNVLGPRCRALITTRDTGLLTSLVGTHHLVELFTDGEALNLLAHAAGVAPDTLPSETQEIVAECGRLPLAIALCGGMVQSGTPWRDVLDALREHDLEYIADEHVTEGQHRSLWVAMEVSLNALPKEPHDEQRRFAELAVFPEDTQIPEATVLTLWSHTGGLSERHARQLLVRLKQRSLVQINRVGDATAQNVGDVSLHDLLRKFAIRLVEQRFGGLTNLHEQLLAAYQKKCPNGWPSGPNDGYFFTHLRTHFVAASRAPELADLLHDLRWLEAKNQVGLTFDLPFDFRAAIDALPKTDSRWRILKLLDEAVRRDIQFIDRHAQDYPQALFQCLWNSCWWYDCPEVRQHYADGVTPGANFGIGLYRLLQKMREDFERTAPGIPWLRSLRPPPIHLGSAQLTVFCGHEGSVLSAAFSVDGEQIVSGSCDGTVRVWDVQSGRQLGCFRGHENWVNAVVYSPDGRKIISGSRDHTIRVWDVQSGRQLGCFRGHENSVHGVALSPDAQRIVSGGGDSTVRIWDVVSGQQLACLCGHGNWVAAVAYSPDSRLIASSGWDKTVRVWNAATGEPVSCLRGHDRGVASVAFSPDSQRIVSGSHDRTVRVWDAISGQQLACMQGHRGRVTSVAYSPDGQRIVSGADAGLGFNLDDQTVRVWNTDSWQLISGITGHIDEVNVVAFSQDGRWLLSGGCDRTVRVWDINSNNQLTRPPEHANKIPSIVFAPNGRQLASAAWDRTVRIWNADNGVQLACLRGHEQFVRGLAYSPDSQRIVSCADDYSLRVWDVNSGQQVLCIITASGPSSDEDGPNCVAFSPDGQRIISGDESSVRVWDAVSGKPLACLMGHDDLVLRVTYSFDGSRIVSSSWDGTTRVWDADSGECMEVIRGPTDVAANARGSARNPWLIVNRNHETIVEDAVTARPTAWFPGTLDFIATAPGGRAWAGSDSSRFVILQLEGVP